MSENKEPTFEERLSAFKRSQRMTEHSHACHERHLGGCEACEESETIYAEWMAEGLPHLKSTDEK